MIDFPDAPTVGQEVVAPDGVTWVWNGATWDIAGSGDSGGSGTTTSAWKEPVVTITTGAIVLSGLQTIDKVAVKEGDRVLVNNQQAADVWGAGNTENGIYIASAGAWTRAPDALTPADYVGAIVRVMGTTYSPMSNSGAYSDTIWVAGRPREAADTWVNFTPAGAPDPYVLSTSGGPMGGGLSLSDHGMWYDFNAAATITLPDPATYPMGFECTFVRNTTELVTFAAAVAGTVKSVGGSMSIASGGVAKIKRIGFYTPMWSLSGDLAFGARMRASLDTMITLGQAIGYISNPVPFGRTRVTDPSVIDHAAGTVSIKQPGLYLISLHFTWMGYHATASAPNTGLVELEAKVRKFADTNGNYDILRIKRGMNPPDPVPQVNVATDTLSASGTYMVDTASEASPFILHAELQASSRITNERVSVHGSAAGPSDGQTPTSYIEVVRFGV